MSRLIQLNREEMERTYQEKYGGEGKVIDPGVLVSSLSYDFLVQTSDSRKIMHRGVSMNYILDSLNLMRQNNSRGIPFVSPVEYGRGAD